MICGCINTVSSRRVYELIVFYCFHSKAGHLPGLAVVSLDPYAPPVTIDDQEPDAYNFN